MKSLRAFLDACEHTFFWYRIGRKYKYKKLSILSIPKSIYERWIFLMWGNK